MSKKVKAAEPEGFAEFWDVWRPHARHTDGRGDARTTFSKHIKNGAEPADIIDGAKWFFRSMKEKDREFVPLASTWLNRGAYEDMAQQERSFQERVEARQPPQDNVVRMTSHKTKFMQEWEAREKSNAGN